MIDCFRNEYYFLSNFYPCEFVYKGIKYLNSEAAFQAQKCLSESEKKQFSTLSANQAKSLGRKVKLRKDWEEVKDDIMLDIVLTKFSTNFYLKNKLLATKNEELIEGNFWGDRYWGQVNGVGQNKLGKILMEVRRILSQ